MGPSPPRLSHVGGTLLALATVPLGLAAGLATQLATGDRRRAVNRALDVWGRWGTRSAGIRLEVEHPEHLEAPRPAVFVLNHQSGVDPILVCALLRRDLFAIAKHELRANPLLGPAFGFAGVVFVKRNESAQALHALEPAVDAIRSGLSLVVTPEGTRNDGTSLGAFKKGAFRVAMAAGVPVIPIVIANAEEVLPQRGWLMRPATVRVSVLEPRPTTSWTLATLDDEIARVHVAFEARLATL